MANEIAAGGKRWWWWQAAAFVACNLILWGQHFLAYGHPEDYYNPGYTFMRRVYLEARWITPVQFLIVAWGLASFIMFSIVEPFRRRLHMVLGVPLMVLQGAFLVLALSLQTIMAIDLDEVETYTYSNMRNVEVALETYRIDFGSYPRSLDQIIGADGGRETIERDMLRDPYTAKPFGYMLWTRGYLLRSAGPDRELAMIGEKLAEWQNIRELNGRIGYDPTNGIISTGDLWKINEDAYERAYDRAR